MAKKSVKECVDTKSRLAKQLKDHKEDHLNFEEEVDWTVSTGSLLFDSALEGGIRPGSVKPHGSTHGGKSSCVAQCTKNFLETVPNSKAIWVKAEGRLDKKFREMTGLKFVFDPDEWEEGTCFVLETNIFEFVLDLVIDFLKNNPENIRYAIVVDSIDCLIRRDDMKKESSESEKIGAAGLLMSTMLKKAGLSINKLGHVLFNIHQVRAKVDANKYGPKDMNKSVGGGGANAVAHAANLVLEFQPRYKTNNIEEGGKVVGHWCHIIATKGVDEKTHVDIRYPIKHGRKGGNSVWVEYEIADMLLQWDLAKKAGAWISIDESLVKELKENNLIEDEEIKVNGSAQLKTWLEENPEITKYLYQKFLKLFSS